MFQIAFHHKIATLFRLKYENSHYAATELLLISGKSRRLCYRTYIRCKTNKSAPSDSSEEGKYCYYEMSLLINCSLSVCVMARPNFRARFQNLEGSCTFFAQELVQTNHHRNAEKL
jgi:hypothetical protein